MKRRALAVAFVPIAIIGAIAYFWYNNPGQLSYALIEGPRWDKKVQRFVTVTIRVDDPQLLVQVQPWRDALRREARDKSLRRFVRCFQGQQHCENALRQPLERLTLVYENGDRESVGDSPVTIRKLLWTADDAVGGQ